MVNLFLLEKGGRFNLGFLYIIDSDDPFSLQKLHHYIDIKNEVDRSIV